MKLSKFSLLLALGLLLSIFMVACSSGDDGGSTSSDGDGDSGEKSGETAKGSEDVEQVLNIREKDVIPVMDSTLSTDAIAAVYIGNSLEGLFRYKDGELTPGIATDHQMSKDGLTYTFTLREDAKWSNGDPVTAHDFVYAWRRALNPDTKSLYGPYMADGVVKNATAVSTGKMPVEKLGVEAKDDYTFVVTLEKPTAYFMQLASFTTFYPLNKKFVEEQGDKYGTTSDAMIYNGPYTMEDWDATAEKWKLVKNPDYWDAENVKMEELNFQVLKEAQTEVDLYDKGKMDRVAVSAELVDQYRSNPDYDTSPTASLFYLKFNQNANDALGNVNIRKALSKAFNKEALVNEVLNDGSTAATGFVPTDFTENPDTGKGFREENGDLVTYDKEKAQELWKKGLKEIGKDKVTLEFLGSDSSTSKTMNEYLKNQWETNLPGLSVNLKEVPFKQKLDLDTSMNYQIQFSGWLPDYQDANTWLNLWVTDGTNNHTGYSSDKYDGLIESAANELALKPLERYQAFLKAGQLLAKDAVIAPIYQESRSQLISPKIQGVVKNPTGTEYDYKWTSVKAVE